MHSILETERLSLRTFTLDDTSFIIELVNSPGWLAYIGDRNIKTEDQAKTYLENGPLKSYKDNGFGLWLVEMKTDKRPIGMCGILKRDQLEHPDIGFAFLPAYTGQGFGFEAAQATLKFVNETLHIKTLCAITLPSNNSSIKLLEKIGMQFNSRFHFPNDKKEELLLYTT